MLAAPYRLSTCALVYRIGGSHEKAQHKAAAQAQSSDQGSGARDGEVSEGARAAAAALANRLMYTKVFRSIYDGTLADNWQAMVTFQQMLILADSQGVVDMTPGAMARITGIPLEILAAGIAVLEAPDAGSRTPEMEGRRIARLDAHRDWGWFLVNFAKYRAMQTREEKNEADRERMRTKRAAERSNSSQVVAGCSELSQVVASVADVAHTDLDLDLDSKKEQKPKATPPAAPDGGVVEGSQRFTFKPPGWVPADAWSAFVEMRRKIRAPLTNHAAKLAVDELDSLRSTGDDPVAVLNQSVMNSWRGLFAVKSKVVQLPLAAAPEPVKASHRPLAHTPRG